MKRILKIYWLLTTYSVRTSFQNPLGATLFLFGKFFRFFVYFYFVYNILHRTKLLAGYTIEQTIIVFSFNLFF
jgi:hypothetical protein